MINAIQKKLSDISGHVLFDYNGKACGFDPLSRSRIDMWYGDENYTVKDCDEALNKPIFDGKSFYEIADNVEMIEY